MNPVLLDCIANYAVFLEVSGQGVLDHRTGREHLEQLKAALRRLTTGQREEFARYVRTMLATDQSSEAYSHRARALRSLIRYLEEGDQATALLLPGLDAPEGVSRNTRYEASGNSSIADHATMDPLLMDMIIEFSVLLNTSGSKVYDRDAAAQWTEYLGASLAELSEEDRVVLIHYAEEKAAREQRDDGMSERVDHLLRFNEGYGLIDASDSYDFHDGFTGAT